MNYYIIVNKVTKDIESAPATTGTSESFTLSENSEVVEVDEATWKLVKKSRSGSYYNGNTVIVKPARGAYDTWDHVAKVWLTDTNAQLVGESINVREMRNYLLGEMDKIVSNPLRWADMSAAEKLQWTQYRHSLLNVPQQDGFPLNVIWPVEPTQPTN